MRRNLNKKPIDQTREEYERHGVDFDETMRWCLDEGWVVSTPYIFAMGYFWMDGEELVCHITYLCGEMKTLLRLNLFSLDKIEFQRNFSGHTKMYDFKQLSRRILNG